MTQATSKTTISCTHAMTTFLFVVPPLVIFGLYGQLLDWALYSEDEVLDASVMHPLFWNAEHSWEEYWTPSMRQRERLSALANATHVTGSALRQLGLDAFLESSGLIGWLRHGEAQMPWETDGDVGIIAGDCRAANVTKGDLARVIDSEYEVLKFACSCEEHCQGDNKRMVGRVTHRATGVCVDIFAYAPVRQRRRWQQEPQYATVDWWERVDDHSDFTFPREALLPLQEGRFEGTRILLPQRPREFLSWEYGRCLGVHVWPWRLLLYTPVSILVPTAIVAKGAVLLSGPRTTRSPWPAATFGAYAAAALALLQGGLAVLALMATCVCELGTVLLKPNLCGGTRTRWQHQLAVLGTFAVLGFELRGSVGQLFCQIDDYYLRPLRPKAWTLCLLGQCWDFGG